MNMLPQRKVTPGQIVMMAVLFALLTVTVVWASGVWVLSGDTALPYRAWTALVLGTALSVVVGWRRSRHVTRFVVRKILLRFFFRQRRRW